MNKSNTAHVVLLGQQVGRIPSLGLCWLPKVCCECGFMLMATPRAAHHARDTGAAASEAACPGSEMCQLKTLRQEQSVGAGISYMSFAGGRNQSQRYTLGKKELQALFISSPSLPALGREQLLLKKRGFIFCHVRCHGFSPPIRPYPSYYRSKLAGKKCWQLGVQLP